MFHFWISLTLYIFSLIPIAIMSAGLIFFLVCRSKLEFYVVNYYQFRWKYVIYFVIIFTVTLWIIALVIAFKIQSLALSLTIFITAGSSLGIAEAFVYVDVIIFAGCIIFKKNKNTTIVEQINQKILENKEKTKIAFASLTDKQKAEIADTFNIYQSESKINILNIVQIKIIVSSMQNRIFKKNDDNFNLVAREEILKFILQKIN